MANYVSITRSNYFRVTDPKRFERTCRYFGVDVWTEDNKDGQTGTFYAVGAEHGEGWPSSHPETGDEIDWQALLQSFLDPHDIAILIQANHEGLRFVGGHACALHADGRAEHISLSQIHDIARSAFGPGVTITEATF